MNKLKERYKKEISKDLQKELKLDNQMAVPTLEKIVVNVGMGEVINNSQALEKMSGDLTLITGQKPLETKAKKAISNFQIRMGQSIGLKVTLRGDRMWDFYEKLVDVILPRIRDFRGVSRKSFDGQGNYALGVKDHTVFPEIDPNKIDKIRSFEVIIVTTAKNDTDGVKLLSKLGMPFTKEEDAKMLEKMSESLKKERKEQAKMKAKRMAEGKNIEERRSVE
jgi:large subunit ribosomal protein L5